MYFINNNFSTFTDVFFDFQFSEYCEKYAKPEDIGAATEEKSSDEEDEELTEDEYDSSDEQIAGKADP
jgi:ubiquitin-conjugating enzyme E2 H